MYPSDELISMHAPCPVASFSKIVTIWRLTGTPTMIGSGRFELLPDGPGAGSGLRMRNDRLSDDLRRCRQQYTNSQRMMITRRVIAMATILDNMYRKRWLSWLLVLFYYETNLRWNRNRRSTSTLTFLTSGFVSDLRHLFTQECKKSINPLSSVRSCHGERSHLKKVYAPLRCIIHTTNSLPEGVASSPGPARSSPNLGPSY